MIEYKNNENKNVEYIFKITVFQYNLYFVLKDRFKSIN